MSSEMLNTGHLGSRALIKTVHPLLISSLDYLWAWPQARDRQAQACDTKSLRSTIENGLDN